MSHQLIEVEGQDIIGSKEAAVFVLDVSGSMSGFKMDTLKKCYKEFMQRKMNSTSQDLIATVVFPNPNGYQAWGSQTPQNADLVSKLGMASFEAMNALNTLSGSGNTPMAAGMRLAADELDKTDLAIVRMVVMTDGEPDRIREDVDADLMDDLDLDDDPSSKAYLEKYVELASSLFIDKGIIVDTVAIGRSVNESLLKRMAQAAGGIFTQVDSIDDYRQLMERVESERKALLGDGIRLLPEHM